MNQFKYVVFRLFFLMMLFSHALHSHSDFDIAILRAYEKNPLLGQSTNKITTQNNSMDANKLYRTVNLTTTIVLGMRLSHSYYLHRHNRHVGWLAFTYQWQNNIYFFSDASRIVLQTMVAKFIIKGIFWYVQL